METLISVGLEHFEALIEFSEEDTRHSTLQLFKYSDGTTEERSNEIPSSELSEWVTAEPPQKNGCPLVASFDMVAVRTSSFSVKPEYHMKKNVFVSLYDSFHFHPIVKLLICNNILGFHVLEEDSASGTGNIICFFLQTYNFSIAWSYNIENASTKAIYLYLEEVHQPAIREYTLQHKDLVGHLGLLAVVCAVGLLGQGRTQWSEATNSIINVETLTGFFPLGEDLLPPQHIVDLGEASRSMGSVSFNLIAARLALRSGKELGQFLEEQSQGPLLGRIRDEARRSAYTQQCQKVAHVGRFLNRLIQSTDEDLSSCQERAIAQLTVLFNLISREDANASVELAKDSKTIALASQRDSSSMKTIAIMTMVFLPATFFAAFFALPLLKWDTEPVIQTHFWIYWAFTLPFTAAIVLLWWFLTLWKDVRERRENQQQRGKVSQRIKSWRREDLDLDAINQHPSGIRDDEYRLPTLSKSSWVQKVLRRRNLTRVTSAAEEEMPMAHRVGTVISCPGAEMKREHIAHARGAMAREVLQDSRFQNLSQFLSKGNGNQ